MSDTDKPKGEVYLKTQNGKDHHAAAADGELIKLPEGYWRGCTEDGRPRDPGHPWHWCAPRKSDS